MVRPQQPVWSEGTFLSPQHLQAQDRFHETLLHARVEAIAPARWGVAALEIDPAALAAGQLRVQRFEGIFPDGLPVAFDEGQAEAPAPRALGERFPVAAASLEVFLAVAREREGIAAYAAEPGAAAPARYGVASRPVQDATRPGATAVVAFARPRTALLLGAEPREDHEAIKIAEVVRTGAGQLALAEGYVPPLLRLAGAPRLLAALRELLTRLHAKHRELAAGRPAGEPSGPDVARLLQLAILGGALPELSHLVHALDGDPRGAYLGLARLAGQLAAFAPDADVAGLPGYAHGDLRDTFEPLLARIGGYLGGLARERYLRVPLERQGNLWLARPDDDLLARLGQLYLSVQSELPEVQVAEQLPRLCKIAAASDVQALVRAAAPGLPLQVALRPPPELPVSPGVVYFRLGQGERLWKGVLADRSIAVYAPPPFDPGRTRIELLALQGGGGPP